MFSIIVSAAALIFSVSAKSSKKDAPKKYVHPRVYEIDLTDSENKVYLFYNHDDALFEGEMKFTRLVKYDMPLAGDKIIFHYEGYTAKDAGKIIAELFDKSHNPNVNGEYSYKNIAQNQQRTVAENALKEEPFKGTISFILTSDLKEDLVLVFYSDKENQIGKIDQTHISFKRVIESVNTYKEQEELQKAEKKNLEVEEVQEEIVDDYVEEETPPQESEEERIAREKQEQEILEKERLERLAKEAEERQKAEEELLQKKLAEQREKERLLQEELQEALRNAANSDVERYEKEYLQDYMVIETSQVMNEISIVSDDIEDPNLTDSFGRTLLMKASQEGNDWKVSRLLKAGAAVNARDKDGWTALMYAVRYQDGIECVNLLINAGAEIKSKNIFDSSALCIAASYSRNPAVLKKLLSYYQPSEKEVLKAFSLLLSDSTDSEYVQISKINEFINLSVPVNSYYEGKTPLMYACMYGSSTKVIQLLLDHNSLVSLRSDEGLTAFDYAKKNKNLNYDKTYWLLNNY